MTPKVNGNDGNGKSNLDALKAYYEAIKNRAVNAPKTTHTSATPETKELGDELLTANFYNDMGVNFTKRPEAGSLEDLKSRQTLYLSGNIEQADAKASIEAIEQLPISEHTKIAMQLDVCNTYLGYGQLAEPEDGQISTKDGLLRMFA